MTKADVFFFRKSGLCCDMLDSSVVEWLLIIALDSKGWFDNDYTESLEIIWGNKRNA